jgi:hypothetical protein
MRIAFIAVSALFITSSAAAMPVSTFLQKAQALKAAGPLALLSGDYRLLKNELSATMEALRLERLAAVRAGRPPAYCPTQQSGSMSVGEIMGAMNAVPPAARQTTDVKDAMRAHMARRFPCKS